MELKNLIYLIKLRFPNYPINLFLLYMVIRYKQVKKLQSSFKLTSVPSKLIRKMLENSPTPCEDENNCLIISQNYLLQSGINSNCVALYQDGVLKRTCYLIGSNLNEDVLYVSDCLKFNLKVDTNVQLRKTTSFIVANELNLSLISSPYDLNNETIDQLLENYFKTPKIVKEGDLIAVGFKKFNAGVYYSCYKLNGLEIVYFKVNKVFIKQSNVLKLTNKAIFCVYGETTIKQGPNAQSYVIPQFKLVRHFEKTDGGNFENCLMQMCPFGLETYVGELEKSVKPFLSKKNIHLKPTFLIQGNKGCGKYEILTSLTLSLGLHLYEISSGDITSSTYSQTETKLHNFFFKAKLCSPCIISINNFENFGKNNEGQYDKRIINSFKAELEVLFANNPFPIILICVSNSRDVPTDLLRIFLQIFDVTTPDDSQRLQTLKWILQMQNLQCDDGLENVAQKARGFVFEDLKALAFHAQQKSKASDLLCESDFSYALDLLQSKYTEGLGAPKIPKVTWSDVGGLTDVKEEIIKTINLPLKHPELTSSGLKRSGILLYGPPGTGKTLLAKAVATECNLCFLSVKGPELLNMYVGQSEKNIREVFEKAREASPCIIFFDELDSLAPNRGISGDSGGVMDRVVSQLLAEMDGLNQSSTIFIIGATNRPDLIDQALLRPGRFDKLLYVGPCTNFKSKLSVIKALTRKFNFASDVNLKEIIRICPENITGADFYGLASNAWMCAVRRLITSDESTNCFNLTHRDVTVTFDDFKDAIETLKPSITIKDLAYFETLQKQYNT